MVKRQPYPSHDRDGYVCIEAKHRRYRCDDQSDREPVHIAAQALRPDQVIGKKYSKIKDNADHSAPTTAAVIAFNGAVNDSFPWVVSIKGAPIKIKIKLGKKVKNVTTPAPVKAETNRASGPNTCVTHPPTNPTNVTTMMSGPGVVPPQARLSIICPGVSHRYCSTAP